MQRMWIGVLCTLALMSLSAQAWGYELFPIDENFRERYWKRSKFPLKITLDRRGSGQIPMADVQNALQLSAAAWNGVTSTIARFEVQPLPAIDKDAKFDGEIIVQFIRQQSVWKYGTLELARTETYYNTRDGELLDADIVINDWNTQIPLGIAAADKYDLQAMLTHEMGHIFGLGHSQLPSATMYASANPGEISKRNLTEDDRAGVRELYPQQAVCQEGQLSGELMCYNGRYTRRCAPYQEVCKPCQENTQCMGTQNFCVGVDGGRCGYDCSGTSSCPAGYTCRPISDPNDPNVILGRNCVPDLNTCSGAVPFPCCRNDNDCLAPFQCVSGNCIDNNACTPSGERCDAQQRCCNENACVDDGAGARCRERCDPLFPRCTNGLRCAVEDGSDFKRGFCVPSNNGGKEGSSCDAQSPCEYELGCNPQENRCRFFCDPARVGTCPAEHRCLPVQGMPSVGLCIKETGETSCRTASECATGRVCKNERCAPCAADTDCPPRNRCITGFCRAECALDTDCPRQHRCDNGFCQPGTACTSNQQCPAGQICRGSICTIESSPTCTQNTDCAPGQRCVENRCRFVDACNNLCTEQEKCLVVENTGRCTLKVCTSDSQCGQGLRCLNNSCEVAEVNCGGRGPCQSGQECVNSQCRSTLGFTCTGDEGCMPGLVCITLDGVGRCSRNCLQTNATDCGDGFFCIQGLPQLNIGCWPASQSDCTVTPCRPKRAGCGCESGEGPTSFAGLLVLLALLLLLRRQRRDSHA